MKKSSIILHSPKPIDIEPPNTDIPKCSSTEQFFTLNNVKKRKNNFGLGQSLKISPTPLNFEPKHKRQDSEGILSKRQISEVVTDTTDHEKHEGGISFKKNKQKRRINQMQFQKIPEQKKMGFILPKIEQISWNSSQNFQLIRSPKRQRNLNLQNTKKTSISDFIILKKLGTGSYSEVFAAVERKTGFICALKKLNKRKLIEEDLLGVMTREIKIHYFLQHQNIINFYGWFHDKEFVYLICEYCCEGDLYSYMNKKASNCEEIGVHECSYLIKQVCDAVAAMHERSLMHRDVKPQNIFLTLGNVAKLGDLGWSVSFSDQNLRETLCGTPLYLAPEQLSEKCEYSHSVDIWALGILTFELFTGEIPFKINSAQDLNKIVSQEIDFGSLEDPIAKDFVQKLLQKQSTKRVQLKDILQHPFLKLHEQQYF